MRSLIFLVKDGKGRRIAANSPYIYRSLTGHLVGLAAITLIGVQLW